MRYIFLEKYKVKNISHIIFIFPDYHSDGRSGDPATRIRGHIKECSRSFVKLTIKHGEAK
jgi:hypothetical protein